MLIFASICAFLFCGLLTLVVGEYDLIFLGGLAGVIIVQLICVIGKLDDLKMYLSLKNKEEKKEEASETDEKTEEN